MVKQVEMLEHHPDTGVGPCFRKIAGRAQAAANLLFITDVFTVDGYLPPVQRFQVVNQAQQRALARTARAHQDHDFTALDHQVDASKYLLLRIGLLHVVADDEGIVGNRRRGAGGSNGIDP
jgi:hypothetical protein